MNKLLIPTILTATLVVAGIFAFMPIEQASTVHTTITAQLVTTATATVDLDALVADVDIIADSATVKKGTICAEIADPGNDWDTGITAEITTGGLTVSLLSAGALETDGECADFSAFRLFVIDDAGTNAQLDYVVAYSESNP